LRHDLAVEAELARLFERDLAPQLVAQGAEAIVVELPESLDPYLGAANLGKSGPAETAEYVADAPDPEADDQEADNDGHDPLAEPIGGGFAYTSKHEQPVYV
jgi:hypothetical protein